MDAAIERYLMVMTMIHDPSAGVKAQITLAGFRRGFVKGAPFILGNGIAGVVMGVAYRGAGLGFVPAALFSIAVYSATAQAVTLGMWASAPPLVPMVFACIATNARYLLMGAQLHRLFGTLPRRTMLPILFLLADASWLMTIAEAEITRADAGYLLGASVPMALGWMGGTALGYALPLAPGGPLAEAAALLPAAFVAALLPAQWHGRPTLLPWTVSIATAAAVSRALAPDWAMLIGGAVGTITSMKWGSNE